MNDDIREDEAEEESRPDELEVERHTKQAPSVTATAGNREFYVLALGTMALLFGALAVLIFLLFVKTDGGPAQGARVVAECEEGPRDTCDGGRTCVVGTCVLLNASLCPAGTGCGSGTCSCSKGLVCRDDACVPAPTENAACNEPNLQKLLGFLEVSCQKNGAVGVSCTETDLRRLAIEDSSFDALMASVQQTSSVHFPWSMPPIYPEQPRWPNVETKAHYREQLRKLQKSFDEAKLIFLVGRASLGGLPQENQKFGHARMTFVRDRLAELYDDRPPAEVDAMTSKLRWVAVGDKRQLTADFYLQHLDGRMIAASPKDTERLAANLAAPQSLSAAERVWTINTINQVVIIVPVPCDATGAK